MNLSHRTDADRRYVPLFWRLFIPNACVLAAACVVLILEPANGRIPALVGGLTVLLVVNLALMRRATDPLTRLIGLMRDVDPLNPGQRIVANAPSSEVTVLSEAFNQMLDRVETERRESARRELLAQEGERRRVAAELHDEIGQTVTALVLELDRAIRDAPEDRRPALVRSRAVAGDLLDDVRRLARSMRPEVLDELGLIPALTNLADRLAVQTGVEIEPTMARDLPELPADVEFVIYRIAQESLTNVIRHSNAERAELALTAFDGLVELVVRDQGAGVPDPPVDGSGIRGMRERALLVDGRLSLRCGATGGTEVRLQIPVDGQEA